MRDEVPASSEWNEAAGPLEAARNWALGLRSHPRSAGAFSSTGSNGSGSCRSRCSSRGRGASPSPREAAWEALILTAREDQLKQQELLEAKDVPDDCWTAAYKVQRLESPASKRRAQPFRSELERQAWPSEPNSGSSKPSAVASAEYFGTAALTAAAMGASAVLALGDAERGARCSKAQGKLLLDLQEKLKLKALRHWSELWARRQLAKVLLQRMAAIAKEHLSQALRCWGRHVRWRDGESGKLKTPRNLAFAVPAAEPTCTVTSFGTMPTPFSRQILHRPGPDESLSPQPVTFLEDQLATASEGQLQQTGNWPQAGPVALGGPSQPQTSELSDLQNESPFHASRNLHWDKDHHMRWKDQAFKEDGKRLQDILQQTATPMRPAGLTQVKHYRNQALQSPLTKPSTLAFSPPPSPPSLESLLQQPPKEMIQTIPGPLHDHVMPSCPSAPSHSKVPALRPPPDLRAVGVSSETPVEQALACGEMDEVRQSPPGGLLPRPPQEAPRMALPRRAAHFSRLRCREEASTGDAAQPEVEQMLSTAFEPSAPSARATSSRPRSAQVLRSPRCNSAGPYLSERRRAIPAHASRGNTPRRTVPPPPQPLSSTLRQEEASERQRHARSVSSPRLRLHSQPPLLRPKRSLEALRFSDVAREAFGPQLSVMSAESGASWTSCAAKVKERRPWR